MVNIFYGLVGQKKDIEENMKWLQKLLIARENVLEEKKLFFEIEIPF